MMGMIIGMVMGLAVVIAVPIAGEMLRRHLEQRNKHEATEKEWWDRHEGHKKAIDQDAVYCMECHAVFYR